MEEEPLFGLSLTTAWAASPHNSPVCKRANRSPSWKGTGVSDSLAISKVTQEVEDGAMASNISVFPKYTVPFSPFIPKVPG